MHGGIIHLFFNLLFQLAIGLGYEKTWRIYRMVPIYIGSGISGVLLSCIILPRSVSIGASGNLKLNVGALFGLIGAKVSYVICNWFKMNNSERFSQLLTPIMVLIFSIFFSFSSNIDWAGSL
jgi:membrane associated rhomboid family serine protease